MSPSFAEKEKGKSKDKAGGKSSKQGTINFAPAHDGFYDDMNKWVVGRYRPFDTVEDPHARPHPKDPDAAR